ncbi:hypothetical protein GCM10027614_47150 [Micromonospora vulcania]
MIEDDLRAAFARHESLTPSTGPLRAAIDRLVVGRRRRRRRWQAGGTALALLGVLGLGVPLLTPERAGPPQAADLISESARPVPTDAVNILLLGIDGNGRRRRGQTRCCCCTSRPTTAARTSSRSRVT